MKQLSINKLDALSKELDIFSQQNPVHIDFLQAGMYLPLPVTGTHLIHGFPILDAAKKIGLSELNVIELDARNTTGMLKISLACENRPGAYSWQEKERVFRLPGWSDQADEIIRLIEGKPDPGFIERIKAYIGLSPALKQLVEKNYIDIKSATSVNSLPDEVFGMAGDLKDQKKLTSSEVRIFLTFLLEIARRDSLSTETIVSLCREIALPSGDGAPGDGTLPSPGDGAALLNKTQQAHPLAAIRRLRYPKLTGLEDRFYIIEEKVIKGSGISLAPPPYFEGSSYTVQFGFQSRKQLEKRIKVLEKLAEESDELFGLL